MWLYSVLVISIFENVTAVSPAIDDNYVNSFIDDGLCENQLEFLAHNELGEKFRTASAYVTPESIKLNQILSYGSYSTCISIDKIKPKYRIEGKYCLIRVRVPNSCMIDGLLINEPWADNTTVAKIKANNERLDEFCKKNISSFHDPRFTVQAELGVCIPKTCSANQAAKTILSNFGTSDIWSDVLKSDYDVDGFEYELVSCRLPNDKPMIVADYIAIAFFAVVFILVVISTVYDLYSTDTKSPQSVFIVFSVYTNSRDLVKIDTPKKCIECLDGIRVLSMLWIILLHCFETRRFAHFTQSYLESTVIYSGVLSIDTFLLLSGILVVYSIMNRFNKGFFKYLPKFYLNRLVRLLPILVLMMLLVGSLLNHISDGPLWGSNIASRINHCRYNWLTSLFFLQNLVQYCDPGTDRCLQHAWYVDVDTQLYFISPLVLYWLLKSRRTAFIALTGVIITFLGITLGLSFALNFPFEGANQFTKFVGTLYFLMFYRNPLARGAAFFIGMFCGYVLHLFKGQHVKIDKKIKYFGWMIAMFVLLLIIFSYYVLIPLDTPDVANCILNTFLKSFWAAAVGWIVFACHHGFGGIINWFLSLKLWKLPSKLSYGIYLVHFELREVIFASEIEAQTHTVGSQLFMFLSLSVISMMITFVLTVAVEMPIVLLYNILTGSRKPLLNITEQRGIDNNTNYK